MPRGRHPNSLGALQPAQPGEVRNPPGINGATYRDRFELEVDRLLAEEEPSANGKTRSQLLAELVLDKAMQGEKHALALVMRRVWPERQELRAHVTRAVSVSPDEAYGETLREIAGQLSDDALRLLTSAARVMREGSARLRESRMPGSAPGACEATSRTPMT